MRRLSFIIGALCILASCGGSTAKSSSPTTLTTTSTTVAPTVAFPACPAHEPTLTAPPGARPTELIPITATRLRVCAYTERKLTTWADALDAAPVAEIERTGNAFRFPAIQNFMCPLIRPDVPVHAVDAMFADAQTVVPVVVRDTQCPPFVATNGAGAAFTTKEWFDALVGIAAPKSG